MSEITSSKNKVIYQKEPEKVSWLKEGKPCFLSNHLNVTALGEIFIYFYLNICGFFL